MNIFLTILRYIPHAATVATAVYFFILNSARPTTDPSLYEGYDVYPFMVEGLLVSLATLIVPVVLMLCLPERKQVLRSWFAKTHCTFGKGALIFLAMTACSFALLTVVTPTEEQNTVAMFLHLKPYEMLIIGAGISIAVPIVEELLFRGVLMYRVQPTFALYFSSVIFAIAHGPSIYLWGLFLSGLCMGKIRQMTGSLWTSIACHGAFNALSLLIAVYDL